MKAKFFIVIILFFSYPSFSQVPIPCCGKIIRHDNFKSNFVDARNIDVWLPENYNPKNKYAVLYMHDGQMLFDSTTNWNKQEWQADETVSKLIKNKSIPPCIIVGIWNSDKNRHIDYFPQKPFESLPQEVQDSFYAPKNTNARKIFNGKVQSDNYLKFLVKELKPFIDSNYSTNTNRQHTFIAGSSMGGLISMYAICEYPDIFGGAACLSTHWPGIFSVQNNPAPEAFMKYLKNHLPSPKTHKIYFDFGTNTLDAYYEPFQLQADQIMKAKGFTPKNWMTKKFEGEDHSEKAWAKRFSIPLIFIMNKN